MLNELPGGEVHDGNTTFKYIQRLRKRDQRQGNAVVSVATGLHAILSAVMRTASETGRHATQKIRQNMNFKPDKVRTRWNDTAQVQKD